MEASKKHFEIIQEDCQLSKISNPISLDNFNGNGMNLHVLEEI